MKNESKGLWHWALVRAILLGAFVLFTGFILIYGFNEEGWRLCIRWSVRISVTCFILAFMARGLHSWLKNSFSFWILMNRRHLGITFAIMHLFHLFSLAILQWAFHPVFTLAKKTSLIAGGLAYAFIVLMLLTSFQSISKYLTKMQWRLLHTMGGYWIWMIFFNSYFRGVLRKEYWDLVFLTLLVAVLGFRIFAFYQTKSIQTRKKLTE